MDPSISPSLIALSLNDWFGQWMNRQYLLSRFGIGHRVVYSTGAWTIWERATLAWKTARVFGRAVEADNVVVEQAPRWLLRWPRYGWIDGLALYLHARRLRRLASGGRKSHTVAILFHPSFYPYLRFLLADLVAYHAYDLFADMQGWNPRLERMEDAILREAHLVTAVTPSIADKLRLRVQREIRILPNGVDIEAFSRAAGGGAAAPADLAAIPPPRLGYLGSLHPQVDFGLIAELAARRPAWQFVFVGGRIAQKHARAESELELCSSLPNVHFLGHKGHDEIPLYALNMDVNIMCYRLSEGAWVKSGYPLKLNEYLAAAAPIVSADLESVRAFMPLVRIATGVDQWEQALVEALAENAPRIREARRTLAQQNGWDERARQWWSWLVERIPRGRSGDVR